MSKATRTYSKQEPPGASRLATRLSLVVLTVLLVAGAIGAGYWRVFPHKMAAASGEPPGMAPAYLALDPMVVNLRDDGQESHVMRIAITLRLLGPEAKNELSARMPEIRNHLLDTLSDQHASSITSLEGKVALKKELMEKIELATKGSRASGQVAEVLFTELVVQ